MKYGLIPTNILERLALWSGKLPVPMMDALFGPMKTRAIMAGVTLGIFEGLRDGPLSADVLASRLTLDAGALDLLLRTLVMCEYLTHQQSRFALSPLARRTMLHDAPMPLVGYMRFNYEQLKFLDHLEALVRTGRGLDFHETMTDPQSWADYQRGMLEAAHFAAPIVAARVPVPRQATSLLDLAGSHGLLGAAICRRHPPLRSTVIDLPQAVVHARRLAETAGIADIVTHRDGNLLTSDLGRDHDVVLLSNILHHFRPETNQAILARVRDALRRDGVVAIWELEAPRRDSPVTSGDGAALYFRLTSTAGAYHGDEYAGWLREAGFERITVVRPALAPGNVLVTARR